ncbi:MAG: fasciclin domain-containing protein [Chitinophagaceae bacterium]|nr:fasciclin domain-containing protein [Chitinophagaceae bacterium]
MKQNKMKLFAVAAFSAIVFISCGSGETKETTADTTTTKSETAAAADTTSAPATPATVVDITVGSADHTTLVAAVKAAGLVETLSGAGPFTVFTPTNAAFDKLPKGTVEGLLKPEKKADLTGILTYHVVAGSFKAADLKDGQMLKTVNGKELKVTIKDGKVMINGAAVTAADLVAGNGVVHVIDAVVLPKK